MLTIIAVRPNSDDHQHPGQSKSVSAMRRTSVFEKIQIMHKRLKTEAFFFRLAHQNIAPMFTLSSSSHFQPAPKQVEAFCDCRVFFVAHAVESAD